jgi:D-alanine-D-alanine ligase
VIFTGTNIGDYGTDLADTFSFEQLLARMLSETSIERVRLSSLDPVEITPGILKLVGDHPRLCPHFHVSLQSPQATVLRRMKRKYSTSDVVRSLNAIAEGVRGRNRKSQVPSILELFDIPYAGSDALTMGVTLDKALAKTVVGRAGIPTPAFLQAASLDDLSRFALRFPVIVKPGGEGTSKGISAASLVRDAAQLRERTAWVLDAYRQPALVEEFVAGREFTVAVIGNEPAEVLPPVQIYINGSGDLGDEFYTHERVTNGEVRYVCPAPASAQLLEQLQETAATAYTALGCRDLARLDFRVDRDGTPYFLECNPLPHLGRSDVFPLVAGAAGLTYDQLLVRILDHACRRNGVTGPNALSG